MVCLTTSGAVSLDSWSSAGLVVVSARSNGTSNASAAGGNASSNASSNASNATGMSAIGGTAANLAIAELEQRVEHF